MHRIDVCTDFAEHLQESFGTGHKLARTYRQACFNIDLQNSKGAMSWDEALDATARGLRFGSWAALERGVTNVDDWLWSEMETHLEEALDETLQREVETYSALCCREEECADHQAFLVDLLDDDILSDVIERGLAVEVSVNTAEPRHYRAEELVRIKNPVVGLNHERCLHILNGSLFVHFYTERCYYNKRAFYLAECDRYAGLEHAWRLSQGLCLDQDEQQRQHKEAGLSALGDEDLLWALVERLNSAVALDDYANKATAFEMLGDVLDATTYSRFQDVYKKHADALHTPALKKRVWASVCPGELSLYAACCCIVSLGRDVYTAMCSDDYELTDHQLNRMVSFGDGLVFILDIV